MSDNANRHDGMQPHQPPTVTIPLSYFEKLVSFYHENKGRVGAPHPVPSEGSAPEKESGPRRTGDEDVPVETNGALSDILFGDSIEASLRLGGVAKQQRVAQMTRTLDARRAGSKETQRGIKPDPSN